MKKILFFIIAITIFGSFIGCEKEMMDYVGKEGVYFSVRHNNDSEFLESIWPYQPYSNVDFVRIAKDEVDFEVNVVITGPVKNYDRFFQVSVNPDSTTAVADKHYKQIQERWTIPANTVSTKIKVRINRTPDLEIEPVTLGLRLVATNDFELSFPDWDAIPEYNAGTIVSKFDASQHTLRINDIMTQPVVWSGSLQPGNLESGLMGVFSRKKMEFLMEYLDLKYEDFSSTEVMPMAREMLVSSDATAVLIRLFNEKKPVLENDGRLMWIGTVPWNSYVGVPWVPTP